MPWSMNVLTALTERGLLGRLDEVCRLHHVTRAEVCSRSRSRAVSNARQDLWWRLRHDVTLRFSYMEIGRLFARNHTTVMHGVRAFEK